MQKSSLTSQMMAILLLFTTRFFLENKNMHTSENNSEVCIFMSYRRSTTRSLFAIKSRYSEPKREVISELAEGNLLAALTKP